jgi:hypothetical protein
VSIYATLWHLQFPRHGDSYAGCEWIEVLAQGVPAHVGTPTPGYGYKSGDPFASFLPPALRIGEGASEDDFRAVVFVTNLSKKGTSRSGQEYESPLLVLAGADYAAMPFQTLHDQPCDALRGDRPRLVLEMFGGDGRATLMFEDGSTRPGPSTTQRTGGPDDSN